MKPTSDVRPATRNFSVSPRAAMPSVSCKSRNPPSTRASDANVTAYEAAFPFVTLTCARSGPYASAPAETERAASAATAGCHSKRPVRRLSAASVRKASAAVETSLPSASVSVAEGAETLLQKVTVPAPRFVTVAPEAKETSFVNFTPAVLAAVKMESPVITTGCPASVNTLAPRSTLFHVSVPTLLESVFVRLLPWLMNLTEPPPFATAACCQ